MLNDSCFARGKRSRVFLVYYNGRKAVKKVYHSRFISNSRNETYWLLILNKYGIGPKLFCFGEGFVVMEFIGGQRIIDFFDKSGERSILRVVSDVFHQCRKLDELGVDKKELTNPYKHIIVRRGKPVMIDFERCKQTLNPKNVTQFVQFLTSARVMSIFSKKGIVLEKDKLRSLARKYKSDHSHFRDILALFQ